MSVTLAAVTGLEGVGKLLDVVILFESRVGDQQNLLAGERRLEIVTGLGALRGVELHLVLEQAVTRAENIHLVEEKPRTDHDHDEEHERDRLHGRIRLLLLTADNHADQSQNHQRDIYNMHTLFPFVLVMQGDRKRIFLSVKL